MKVRFYEELEPVENSTLEWDGENILVPENFPGWLQKMLDMGIIMRTINAQNEIVDGPYVYLKDGKAFMTSLPRNFYNAYLMAREVK